MEYKQEDTVACPVCGKAMKLITVRKRGGDEETLVLQCLPCGLSITKTRQCSAAGTIADGGTLIWKTSPFKDISLARTLGDAATAVRVVA
jgi:hypothetical protein